MTDTQIVTIEALTEDYTANADLPPLDRDGVDEATLTKFQRDWRRDGVAIVPALMSDDVIDAYCEAWLRHAPGPGGFGIGTPYMAVPELRDLCCAGPLADVLASIHGEPMGVHLNLTGWRSTQRDWHQDTYLNPPEVNDWYAAVWVALDDIHPDSGPFQYVAGTHRLPWRLTREKMLAALSDAEAATPDWPKHSERLLSPLVEAMIVEQRWEVSEFIAKRGDVLVWHSRLLHRGSPPRVPDMERRAVISHYSALSHRPDMPRRAQWGEGWVFVL